MTIEEIKNNALENIAEFVTDTAKDAFTKWLKEKALPTAREVSEAFITELKNSATMRMVGINSETLSFYQL